jgi:hypothetical protein
MIQKISWLLTKRHNKLEHLSKDIGENIAYRVDY